MADMSLETQKSPAPRPAWDFSPLPMFGYDFVMIDPPWLFDLRSEAGEGKAPQGQYDCMSMDAIRELRVGDLLRSGGVLWCWCTWPLIGEQAACIKDWGFKVKTGGAWIKRTVNGKLRVGTGYIWRSVCEPILIATIGDKHDFKSSRALNLIETHVTEFCKDFGLDGVAREHSRKPVEAYDLIDAILPAHAARADVFSRTSRPGWDVWGNEAGKFDA